MVIKVTMKIPPNEMPIMTAKLNFLSSSLVGTRETNDRCLKAYRMNPLKADATELRQLNKKERDN